MHNYFSIIELKIKVGGKTGNKKAESNGLSGFVSYLVIAYHGFVNIISVSLQLIRKLMLNWGRRFNTTVLIIICISKKKKDISIYRTECPVSWVCLIQKNLSC